MFLKPNEPLAVTCLDGTNMTLILPGPWFRLRDGRLLRGAVKSFTDGLSSGKFDKLYIQSTNNFFPATSHDFFYHNSLEISSDNGVTWQPYNVPNTRTAKNNADNALWELCVDNGVPADEARLIYLAVHEFGDKAWIADHGGIPIEEI